MGGETKRRRGRGGSEGEGWREEGKGQGGGGGGQEKGGRGGGWMDGWMDALRLFRCATPSAQGPLLLLCFLGLSLHSLFIPYPTHALEHALSGRIHSFFHASTYWLFVCACAMLSPGGGGVSE